MLKRLFSFFKRVKTTEGSIFDKARNAVLGVESALSMFSGLLAELEDANKNLQTVADDAKAVIQEHTDLREEAVSAMYEYTNLMNNVQKLVGGTK